MSFDAGGASSRVASVWSEKIVPTLCDYIRIPNVSSAYDRDWAAHGHMDAAVALVSGWMESRPIDGLTVEVIRIPGRTPLILAEVPASAGGGDGTVLLYGHLDKQPPMYGWRAGLGPWDPVIEDGPNGGRLYGRGGADDGYAAFAAMTAIEAVREVGGEHTRCVVLIEASEESGSPDLPAYVEQLGPRLGTPSLVVCLDSGCATYDRLWVTTSLRGNLIGALTAQVLDEGVHSGAAGGVVPSSFRILRQLLDRVEDAKTGRLLPSELWVDVPAERTAQIATTAAELGSAGAGTFPFAGGVASLHDDPAASLRAKTWEPSLAYTGVGGMPALADAGNVLRPSTSLNLSFRLPPTCDAAAAASALQRVLTDDAPEGAVVTFDVRGAEDGWNAPPSSPWLATAVDEASMAAFGLPARYIGEGGTIPFMGMLGARFPDAQFLVTGVLGPESNAHGPNEFLDLTTGRNVTLAVASVLDAHARS